MQLRRDVGRTTRIFAEKPPGGGGGGGGPFIPNHQGHAASIVADLQTTLFEPMLQELVVLEENLEGAERVAASGYRVEVSRFAEAMVAKVANPC